MSEKKGFNVTFQYFPLYPVSKAWGEQFDDKAQGKNMPPLYVKRIQTTDMSLFTR